MREVNIPDGEPANEATSFLACLATVLELPFGDLPRPARGEDPATAGNLSRWLGVLGLGLARVADPGSFSWAGPWIARVAPPPPAQRRFVVMYGVPSGVVWDPLGGPPAERPWSEDGFLVSATDVALALPPRPSAPSETGTIESIWIGRTAGEPLETVRIVRAITGRGLEGDRYPAGAGSFPTGPPGSALTMIAAEVCETFTPPLAPDEHRRNLVTRGIDLNRLVGHDFTVGEVRCRGMRLCEPCTVMQRYASRPVLRELVHRGGLRADIIEGGKIRAGDHVEALGADVRRHAQQPLRV